MKKLLAVLLSAITCAALLVSCEEKCSHLWDEGVKVEDTEGGYVMEYACMRCGEKHRETIPITPPGANAPDADDEQFTDYIGLVTKGEFQNQYKQAFNSLQPDYTKDFVYIYSNDYIEITESGEVRSTTDERTEYDANGQIILFHHEFKSNDEDTPENESYSWEYREKEGMLQFYDGRTSETETRSLGFDEFWEFAHSRIPFVLFPSPYKLYDDAMYYVDLDEYGNTVYTLYSGDENDYSVRQMVFTGTGMLYRTKRYTKEADYEDITIDIYRIYNEGLTLTPISE